MKKKIVTSILSIICVLTLGVGFIKFIGNNKVKAEEISSTIYYDNAIDNATSDDAVESRLIEMDYIDGEKQIVEIAPIYVATESGEVQEQTNWFNEFTKFISQVFGG